MSDRSTLCDRLRRMAKCVYLAAEPTVADDIADGLTKAADAVALCEKALDVIAAPLPNPPEVIDGDESEAVAAWWCKLAVYYRETASTALATLRADGFADEQPARKQA